MANEKKNNWHRPDDRDIVYYWAYGSNLNMRQMKYRCPDARALKALAVEDGQLVFRGVADVVQRRNCRVLGGLWKITPRCLRALDRYEGCASDPWSRNGLYRRTMLRFKMGDKKHEALCYQMNRADGIMPPGEGYLNSIIEGYKDFGLDLAPLDEAVRQSWNDKELTDLLRERHQKRGQRMARGDRVSKLIRPRRLLSCGGSE